MFLSHQFCEDNNVRIEKLHHLASYIADDRTSDLDELMHDMDSIQTQFHITERTKYLADFFDTAHKDETDDYTMKNQLYTLGYHKGIVLEITVYSPGSIGRPILYVYAEDEQEVKDFVEEACAIVWKPVLLHGRMING